jgi:hypothetical protein
VDHYHSNYANSDILSRVSNISKASKLQKTTADVWQHCRTTRDKQLQENPKAQLHYPCLYCKAVSKSTSSFRYHLRAKHDIDTEAGGRTANDLQTVAVVKQMYEELYAAGQTWEIDKDILRCTIDQQLVEKALLDLVIKHRLPSRIVEWQEFHNFCTVLNREYPAKICWSHNTLTSRLLSILPEYRDVVRKRMQSAKTRIHLAVDIWTSPNMHLMLALCASFVDNKYNFHNILIALRTVVGHGGEQQWSTILPALLEYGISDKVGSVVCDNAGSNDTLCRTIAEYLSKEHRISWLATHHRLRCQGHIINLVVHAYLFTTIEDEEAMETYDKEDEKEARQEVELSRDEKAKRGKERANTICTKMGILGKVHNLVVHIRASASRTQEFEKVAGRRIPLDNRTRWNSWYEMLRVIQEPAVQNAIPGYVKKWVTHGSLDKRDIVLPDDWDQLRTITEQLAMFEGATKYLQGDRATLERVYSGIVVMVKWFERTMVSCTIINLV